MKLRGDTSEKSLDVIGRGYTDTDAQEIVALIRRQATRWNEQQPIREVDFTEGSDYVTFDGTELHGYEANRILHESLRRGVLRGSHLTCHIHRLRFLTGDVAIVHSTGNLQLRFHKRPKRRRDSIQTTVVRRTPLGWQIEAFHNTRIRRLGVIGRLLVGAMNRL